MPRIVAGLAAVCLVLLMPGSFAQTRDPAGTTVQRSITTTDASLPPALQTANMPVQWQLDQLRSLVLSLQQEVGELKAQAGQTASTQAISHLQARLGTLESVLQVTPTQVTLHASGNLNLRGATIRAQAPRFIASGTVESSQLITESVVASSYTPGAGNIW